MNKKATFRIVVKVAGLKEENKGQLLKYNPHK